MSKKAIASCCKCGKGVEVDINHYHCKECFETMINGTTMLIVGNAKKRVLESIRSTAREQYELTDRGGVYKNEEANRAINEIIGFFSEFVIERLERDVFKMDVLK